MNADETGILEISPSAFVWVITTCVAQSQSRYYELVPKIKAEHCQNHYNQFLKKWRLAGAVTHGLYGLESLFGYFSGNLVVGG